MLWRLLAGASVSATSLPFLRRVSNHLVPILHGASLGNTPGLFSSPTHPASPGISSFGSHLKLSAVGMQTASSFNGIPPSGEDRSCGEGDGGNGCAEHRGSACPGETEGSSPKGQAKAEGLSPGGLSLLDVAKVNGLSSGEPTKAADLSPEDVENIVSCLSSSESDYTGAMQMLELHRLRPSPDSVFLVLSRLRKNCDAALAFFSWAMRQPDNQLSSREFYSMIEILVRRKRYEAALSLLRETFRSEPRLVTFETVFFLVKGFCANGQTKNAIATFESLLELGYQPGISEFESLLVFLCRVGMVAKAEDLLRRQEKRFPLCTGSLNVVLRGWCEVLVSPRNAKRLWQAMADMGLQHDVGSYGTMIGCLAKSKDMVGVLKLFDEMKDRGLDPDMKVYKGVFTAMVIANRVEEAMQLIRKIKEEKGMSPGAKTFTSVFRSACRDGSVEAAVKLLDMMTESGVRLLRRDLSVKGHYPIFDDLSTGKDMMAVLGALKRAGFILPSCTYHILVRKLCMLQDYDGLFTVWGKMCSEGPKPDKKTYISTIYGLYSKGNMEAAGRFYLEMRTKGFNPEPMADLGFLLRRMNRSFNLHLSEGRMIAPGAFKGSQF